MALDGASRGLADSLDPRDKNVSYDRYNFRGKLTHSSVILGGAGEADRGGVALDLPHQPGLPRWWGRRSSSAWRKARGRNTSKDPSDRSKFQAASPEVPATAKSIDRRRAGEEDTDTRVFCVCASTYLREAVAS
jgi:hypothetical protein